MRGAERSLRLLDLTAEVLPGTLVLGHVLAVFLLEDLHEVQHHPLIEVLAAQVGDAVRGDSPKTPLSMVKRDISKVPPPKS